MAKFIGKNLHKKYVRAIPNRNVRHTLSPSTVVPVIRGVEKIVPQVKVVKEADAVEAVVPTEEVKAVEENVVSEANEAVTENKEIKEEENMSDEKLEKIESIVGAKVPKRKVKVEKKEKGLIERTDNSTILITEDNKMLLND